MKKLALLLALLLLAGASPAMAWIHGVPSSATPQVSNLMVFQGGIAWPGMGTGATASPTCPQGTGFPDDGCTGANPNATFQESNAFQSGGYFNAIAGTTSNYMAADCGDAGNKSCRPLFNVAGVDYPIGNYTPLASLVDPAVLGGGGAGSIPGCTYSATGNAGGGPLLSCGGASFMGVIQHPNLGAVGGHDCTALTVGSAASGVNTLLIDDFNWFNSNGACSTQINVTTAIRVTGTYSGGTVLSNGVMDGNSSVFSNIFGSCAATIDCNPTIAIEASPVTIKYVAMRHFAGNPISGGTTTVQYDWIEGWCARSPTCHTEFFDGPNGGSGYVQSIDHDVLLQVQAASQFGPTKYFWASNWPVGISSMQFTNNTSIDSYIGGLTSPTSSFVGCIGASFVSSPSTCSGSGAIFYLTSGQSGQGTNLPASGCGSSGVLGPAIAITPPEASAGVIGKYVVDGFIGNQYGDLGEFNQAAVACSGTAFAATSGDSSIMYGDGPAPLGSGTVSGNFIDATSRGASPILYEIGTPPSTAFTATVTSPTTITSTVTQIVQSPGSFVLGLAECTTFLTCPTATTAGVYTAGTPIPITTTASTGSVANVGFLRGAWCTTPVSFSNNIDMAHANSDAWMNEWNKIQFTNGC